MDGTTPHVVKKNGTLLDTIAAMKKAALAGRGDLDVRGLVERICDQVAQGDYAGEVLAIYYWVCRNIRYMRDPDNLEMVKIPRRVLSTKSGDCDDIATLLAAMLMAAGNHVRFVIVGFSPQRSFSHVYVEVVTPHGVIVIDPVARRDTAKMLRDIKHRQVFEVSDGPGVYDSGVGRVDALTAKDNELPLRHVGPSGGNLFSVYNYDRNVYEYYEGRLSALPETGRFRKPTGRVLATGAAPEQFARELPAGARKVGEGEVPRGLISARGAALASWMPSVPPTTLYFAGGLVLGFAFARWRSGARRGR